MAGGDAKLAWNELRLRFEPDTGTELVRLMREYNPLQMKTNDDPDEYLTKLENCRSKLKKLPSIMRFEIKIFYSYFEYITKSIRNCGRIAGEKVGERNSDYGKS